jgi:Ion channel
MMTVGYGDITPQNSMEVLFATITVVFGCGVYAYNLNAVGILLSELRKEENKFNSSLRIINKFMDKKKIDTELQVFYSYLKI